MIKPFHLYSTKNGEYIVLVTSVCDNPALEDLEVEYYYIDAQCFSSKKYFEETFKECK